MAILGGVGKDAGLSAIQEAHKALDEAIPAAESAIKNVEDHGVNSLFGLIADVANRLNGAECPVDLKLTVSATIQLSGKIGQLKLTMPDYGITTDTPTIEVKG